MIAPAKLRQILELRRSTRVPPLLPPKKNNTKRGDEMKKGSHAQQEIVDIHVQLRNFGTDAQHHMAINPIACAFSESESDNHRGPWRMSTASELLLSKGGPSVELSNVLAVEFQLENAAKFIRLDICDLYAKDVMVTSSVGYCVFSVSELVSAAGGKIQRKVINDESGVKIVDALISCTIRSKPHAVVFQFLAKNLTKKHLNNASSAQVFFEIHRMPTKDNSSNMVVAAGDQDGGLAICNGASGSSNSIIGPAIAASTQVVTTTTTTAQPPAADGIGSCYDTTVAGADGATSTAAAVPQPTGSLLYRSESIKWHSSRVLWRAFTLKSTDILQRELRMLCFQRGSAKSATLVPPVSLGEFPLFYSVLRRGPGPENIYFLVYENSRHQKKNGGTFELCRFHEVCTPSFLEYISAGASLNLAFAIDFSRSGTFVDEQLVKHYIDDVELLIGAFGGALKDFNNSSNSYPSFGFGAKIPPQFRESQEFCLNLNGTDPYCRGISGVFNAFKTAFTMIEPLNMAHLSHVIYYMAKLAQNSLYRTGAATASSTNCVELGAECKPPSYFVLVIITRGVFDDLKETVQALIFASRAPLSIVFVGIGENEQQLVELERLATAGTRLNFHGRKPERDYTQYVSLPICRREESKLNDLQLAVVERGLCSVPAQMCNWMMRNGYQKVEPVPEMGDGHNVQEQQKQHHLFHQSQHQHHNQQHQQQTTAPDNDHCCSTNHPTTNAGRASFSDGSNGADQWHTGADGCHSSISNSSRTTPPASFKPSVRMRQSAQCLSLGRSSSSSSFGVQPLIGPKFAGDAVYFSAPGSALSIISSAAVAEVAKRGSTETGAQFSSPFFSRPKMPPTPLTNCNIPKNVAELNPVLDNNNNMPDCTIVAASATASTVPQLPLPSCCATNRRRFAGSASVGCVAATARHRRFGESRSLSSAITATPLNYCRLSPSPFTTTSTTTKTDPSQCHSMLAMKEDTAVLTALKR